MKAIDRLLNEIRRITYRHVGDNKPFFSFEMPCFIVHSPKSKHVRIKREMLRIFKEYNEDFTQKSLRINERNYASEFRAYCRDLGMEDDERVTFIHISDSVFDNTLPPSAEELLCWGCMGAVVFFVPLESKLSRKAKKFLFRLKEEYIEAGLTLHELHYDRLAADAESETNLCIEAAKIMKHCHNCVVEKKKAFSIKDNEEIAVSKPEAHWLVDKIFETKNDDGSEIGVIEIIDIPPLVDKYDLARTINGKYPKVSFIDTWLGLCGHLPHRIYCYSSSDAQELEDYLQSRGITCYSY
ncbi:MAG: hypothetical protein IJB43_11325 [Clostridia bacterium]|nr:hypothetical protein [Clostridia bacterium]